MTPNWQMEQLSLAYIRTVAAKAGFQVTRPELDIDSVDGVLMANFGQRPRVDFQAKSTTRNVLRDEALHFPLPLKNYNDLRADTRTPRILIVLLMPDDDARWVTQSEEELCLRHCAYWLSLESHTATANTSNITVQIPTANIFSVDQLITLMGKADRGESLC